MTVGDIHAGKSFKQLKESAADFAVADRPQTVPHSGAVDDIVFRRLRVRDTAHDLRNIFVFAEKEKHRLRVGAAGVEVADTVELLFGARHLVLFYGSVFIVVDGGAADDSGLDAAAAGLAIDVVRGLFFRKKIPSRPSALRFSAPFR